MEARSLSGHNHMTLGKPHPSLSLSLILQTMGSLQGPLSSEGSEDRTWVLESEHLMPKGLTRTTCPQLRDIRDTPAFVPVGILPEKLPPSCFELSGQPATVSLVSHRPHFCAETKQSGSGEVCCLPYSSQRRSPGPALGQL